MVLEQISLVLAVIAIIIATVSSVFITRWLARISEGTQALLEVSQGQQRQIDAARRLRGETIKQRENEQAWRVLGGLAKAFGWAFDRGFFDEEEDF